MPGRRSLCFRRLAILQQVQDERKLLKADLTGDRTNYRVSSGQKRSSCQGSALL